jgi:hypothetical protein
MSDLRPVGVPVVIDGVERHLLFTLNVIDDIQEHFDLELHQIIDNLTDKNEASKTIRYMLCSMLNDEAEKEEFKGNGELKRYTEKEIGWIVSLENQAEILMKIFEAYGISLPAAEDDDPNLKSGTAKE